jgi:phosphotransferase system enzyme I (PtsP)
MPSLEETGADGVGLYRTEIPFMARSSFPAVEEQTAMYRRILDQAREKPVVFRTLDVGGDKLLPYFDAHKDENPAMGWRAIRIALDRPAILRQQLRALATAAADRELHVMFPMVSEVAEFRAARKLLDLELDRLRSKGIKGPKAVRAGAMLEVPALVWQIDQLVETADFVSVGSNDLLQFLFASDRGNPHLAQRYDSLSPSVLGMLRAVVRACEAAGKPVTLCGEMAGDPLEAVTLVGLGFRRLSMPAGSIGPVKEAIRSLDAGRLESYVESLRGAYDHSLRHKLRDFARDHGIPV